jgi:hypothetical protein
MDYGGAGFEIAGTSLKNTTSISPTTIFNI